MSPGKSQVLAGARKCRDFSERRLMKQESLLNVEHMEGMVEGLSNEDGLVQKAIGETSCLRLMTEMDLHLGING